MKRLLVSVLVMVSLALATGHAAAQSRCDGEKLAALGLRADADLSCHARATKDGAPVDELCQANAEAKFIVAAAKADSRGDCQLMRDSSLLADIGARYQAVFARALRPVQDENFCAAAKLKATGDGAKDRFACEAKFFGVGNVAVNCVDTAAETLRTAFAAADTRPPCLTESDAGPIDALVNEFVTCALFPSASTCSSVLQTTVINLVPGTVAGFLPLAAFGTTPIAIGDEEILPFDLGRPFVYNNETYTTIGVSSNGYIVVGGGEPADNSFTPQTMPDRKGPNNVLAPFWTDLDGTGAPGIFIDVLTDGVGEWVVVEWQVNVFGTTSRRTFQVWIGLNGVQDITFTYDPANLPADPFGQRFTVGAENADGSVGNQIGGLPTEDLRVTSTIGL